MKRILIILLCLLLLLPYAISCRENQPTESSEADESETSVDVSDESSEPMEFEADELVAIENAEKINSLLIGTLPTKIKYKNIATGCKYSINLETYEKIADDGKKLTDSTEAPIDDESKWIGFVGRKDIEVTLDLGGLKTNLGGASINCVYNTAGGRNIPKTFELWISQDGANFVKIGTSCRSGVATGYSTVYAHTVKTANTFSATHIKVVLKDFVSIWTLIDSLKVYEVSEDKTTFTEEYYYKNDDMPINVQPSYWENSESDYDKVQNLAAGLKQRIYFQAPLLDELKTDYYNTQTSSKVLTDGKRGGSDYSDSAYFHCTKGLARDFIYDLKHLSSVSSVTIGMYEYEAYGIVVPERVVVYLSENGEDWQKMNAATAENYPALVGNRADATVDLGGYYKARFVKVSVMTGAHVWLDEIEIIGKKAVDTNTRVLVPDEIGETKRSYNKPSDLGGCENILLAYNYKTENVKAGRTTKEGYIPYVGYYDREDNLVDFFFDSYLYLPCSTTCPSGGVLFSSSDTPSIMTDWLDYKNDLFTDGANVKALEEAVQDVKTQLGKDDYKVSVFLSIFNPSKGATRFGDVDNDGIVENASKIADRKKIIKWWIDLQIADYKALNFKNQELVGFYLYDENIATSDSIMKETIKYALSYVHELGYYAIWIPYYQASGYTTWKDMGFDAANMQPNYMFREQFTEQVLYDNADITSMNGMGVEIEIDGKAINTKEYNERYIAYLRVGAEKGYMNGIKMYYQDAGPGVYYSCYKSKIDSVRLLYDLTYKYAKGILTMEAIDIGETLLNAKKNTKYSGKLNFGDNVLASATVKYAPKYGVLTLEADGTVTYNPMENYIGEDTFTITVSNGVSESDVVYTVKVDR